LLFLAPFSPPPPPPPPPARGAPAEALTRDTVERVFSWPVAIEPFDGRPQMIPLRQRKDTP
jgi:hypothetical protein